MTATAVAEVAAAARATATATEAEAEAESEVAVPCGRGGCVDGSGLAAAHLNRFRWYER